MYLILGCGDLGYALAENLKESEEEVQIVEKNSDKVRQLENRDFDVFEGDFTSIEDLKKTDIEEVEVVMILTPDLETVEDGLFAINQVKMDLDINPIVIARATDSILKSEILDRGADEVIVTSEMFAEYVHDRFQEFRERIKEKKLKEFAQGIDGKMAIVLQDNPDPDSIAGGIGLKTYFEHLGISSDLVFSGRIGHQQNRALVNTLEAKMKRAEDVDFEQDYSAYSMVDVSTYGNCSLPEDISPTIIVDHHAYTSSRAQAEYEDIVNVGATATIVTNYLKYSEIEIDEELATSLTFAILTDTMNFTRGATPLDFSTLEYLLPSINNELLQTLQSPPLSADTMEVIRKAIRSSRIKNGYLISNVGEVKNRDAVAQAADYLLRREGTLTSLVYGIEDDYVYISARTKDVRLHIGKTLEELYGGLGSAGGHPTIGGGRIPLDAFDADEDNMQALRGEMDRAIGRKFWEAFGALKSER